ncbi:MAG: hypothetical protein QF632_05300, partial [Candidatus Woesearchaeota archaeon]|nr:hypothetical protein [Candidatus Woesearchaeota archaeon]
RAFLLVFVIMYALFVKTKVLGTRKGINGITAFVIAMIAIIPHVTKKGPDIVPIINGFLPFFSLLLVFGLAFILVMLAFGAEINGKLIGQILVVIIIIDLILPDFLIIALIAKSSGLDLPRFPIFINSPQLIPIAIGVFVFFFILYYIVRETH